MCVGGDRPLWRVDLSGEEQAHLQRWGAVDIQRRQAPPWHDTSGVHKRTSLRRLAQLVYQSFQSPCPVTLLMHLAAAAPLLPHARTVRACVVVAVGRAPTDRPPMPPRRFPHDVAGLPRGMDSIFSRHVTGRINGSLSAASG